jgi:hypothetical protein
MCRRIKNIIISSMIMKNMGTFKRFPEECSTSERKRNSQLVHNERGCA